MLSVLIQFAGLAFDWEKRMGLCNAFTADYSWRTTFPALVRHKITKSAKHGHDEVQIMENILTCKKIRIKIRLCLDVENLKQENIFF